MMILSICDNWKEKNYFYGHAKVINSFFIKIEFCHIVIEISEKIVEKHNYP